MEDRLIFGYLRYDLWTGQLIQARPTVSQNYNYWHWAAFILCVTINVAGKPPLISRALAGDSTQTIVVEVDKAKLVGIPRGGHRIVLGNPLMVQITQIADAVIVLTGTAYGETNMVVFDERNAVVMESMIRIEPSPGTIIVQRGPQRSSYDCQPGCEVRNQLGNAGETADKAAAEIQARNAAASSQTGGNPKIDTGPRPAGGAPPTEVNQTPGGNNGAL
jgi:hypothetical protein